MENLAVRLTLPWFSMDANEKALHVGIFVKRFMIPENTLSANHSHELSPGAGIPHSENPYSFSRKPVVFFRFCPTRF